MVERLLPDDLARSEWDLPPAAEVRRRGQALARRRGRRRTALSGLATAVVVGLPAGLSTSLGGGHAPVAVGDPSRPPDRSATSTPPDGAARWLATVPATVDLTAGMDDAAGPPLVSRPDAGVLVRDPTACTGVRWARGVPVDATDARLAVSSGAATPSERRTLLLFPDDDAAAEAFDAARRQPPACGTGPAGAQAALADDVAGPDADESWAYAVTPAPGPGPDGGTHTVALVRTGNAVLVDLASRSGGLPPGALRAWLGGRIGPVVEELCVFAEDPC